MILALWAAVSIASAQESDALLLSRIAVSESGWNSPDDHAAIYAVIEVRRHRFSRAYDRQYTFADMARLYSPRATGVTPVAGRFAWVATLSEDGDEPAGWNLEAPWERYRARWLRVLERSRMLIDGREEHRCRGTPIAWGAPSIHDRAIRLGLVQISCGVTRNRYYR